MAIPQKDAEQTIAPMEPKPTSGASVNTEECCHDRGALDRLGAELLRRAEESQPALEAVWDELLASWGIQGQPVGVERLRTQIEKECGGSPEDCEFSRELIALREERRP